MEATASLTDVFLILFIMIIMELCGTDSGFKFMGFAAIWPYLSSKNLVNIKYRTSMYLDCLVWDEIFLTVKAA